jgi:peptidoglycan/xylan/chitin deacetylase (PgdA/CDA1 family)
MIIYGMKNQSRFDYEPNPERDFDLPNGENVALWVIPNIEHYKIDVPSTAIYPPGMEYTPDVLNYGWRDYGPRAGIWRMMDVLDKHDVRATVALNAEVCDHQPEIVEAGMERDWEFMGHGTTNAQPHVDLEEDEERKLIEATRDHIEEFTGERPRGWLGPELAETFKTPDLLAEAGFDYLCDWCNDDQPYPMHVEEGDLITVPYSIEINDIPMFLTYGMTGPQFEEAIKSQFDVLHEEGKAPGNAKVMAIALHPFLTGLPFRSKHLDNALEYITGHDDVWVTTGGEIADHYNENYA